MCASTAKRLFACLDDLVSEIMPVVVMMMPAIKEHVQARARKLWV